MQFLTTIKRFLFPAPPVRLQAVVKAGEISLTAVAKPDSKYPEDAVGLRLERDGKTVKLNFRYRPDLPDFGKPTRAGATQGFFRCLLGLYTGSHRRPSWENVTAISEGSRQGRTITLFPIQDRYEGSLSYDIGPALEELHLVYRPNLNQLDIATEVLATCWDQ